MAEATMSASSASPQITSAASRLDPRVRDTTKKFAGSRRQLPLMSITIT